MAYGENACRTCTMGIYIKSLESNARIGRRQTFRTIKMETETEAQSNTGESSGVCGGVHHEYKRTPSWKKI